MRSHQKVLTQTAVVSLCHLANSRMMTTGGSVLETLFGVSVGTAALSSNGSPIDLGSDIFLKRARE